MALAVASGNDSFTMMIKKCEAEVMDFYNENHEKQDGDSLPPLTMC